MSGDEMERFEVTDYDLDNEFNINRPYKRLTKEQQIFGIWAEDSDDDGEPFPSKKGGRKKQKDYTVPIGFVAGGIQQSGKKNEEKEKVKDDSNDLYPDGAPSSSDEDAPDVPDERHTAGLRKRGMGSYQPQSLSGGVGNWEKHTKGIGAKLLLQMGYQPGKGLGKALQGMSTPVTATLRKGRGAIGAYGPEVKMKKGVEAIDENKSSSQGKDDEQKSHQWKKNNKQRYYYRDAEDVIQEGKPAPPAHTQQTAAIARVPVIDLRGPEKRVLSGYHALRAAAPRYEDVSRKECSNLALPELLHNLNLLVDMCEQDIIECSREGQTAEDREIALERDKKSLEEELKRSNDEMLIMEDILVEVQKLEKPDLSLDDAYDVFKNLKVSHPMEYDCLGLGSVGAVGSCLRGLMGSALAAWLPLRSPHDPLMLLEKWTPLLESQTLQEVFWRAWLEQVQLASLEWDVREPGSMKTVIETWGCIAPQQEMRNVLRSAIVPRLTTAAMRWDPTVDTLPLHYWILPWHQFAGDLLEESVYPELRSRLVSALSAWHPADGSALALLRPWSQAWSLALPALTRAHILPRLETCMRTIPTEPDSNPNESWGWCACWQEIIGARALAGAAGRALLPRWLASLASWLNRRPPHAHLISHYSTWKSIFSEELLREPEFADAFRKALDMMNRSMDTPVQAPPPPPPRITTVANSHAIAEVMASSNQQKSFTELLETRCSERGISFIPLVGRTREGRPLYRVGSIVQCYVMRNVVMYSNDLGRTFQPISLDTLLQIASTQP